MTEIVGSTPVPEARESIPTPRDAAVSFGEYYAIYFVGRHDPDKAHDRLPRRDELGRELPAFAPMIKRLDEDLENARGLMKEFDSAPLPRQDEAEMEGLDLGSPRLKRILGEHGRILPFAIKPDQAGSPIPPDYTFASVRHPIARDLLDHLNVATGLGLEALDQPNLRSDALRSNGQRILMQILGENYDPHAVVRLQLTDVLTAVFDGRVSLPSIKTASPSSEVERELVPDPAGQ
jgi:hypothetical protein